MSGPQITEDEVIEFLHAAAENAVALCEDSAALEATQSPRAIALVILAAEELGKAWRAAAALIIRGWMMDGAVDLEGDPDELLRLAVHAGSHSNKMTSMLALETVIPMLAGVEADSLSMIFRKASGPGANDLKKRSFYVDFVAGGEPARPSAVRLEVNALELRQAICKSVSAWSILLPHMAENPSNGTDEVSDRPG